MWAGMLELSFTEYFEKPINTLRALMHARTGGPCKWRDGNPKNHKEVLEVKNIAAEMKNDFMTLVVDTRKEEPQA